MAADTLPVRFDLTDVYRGDSYRRLFRPWYRAADGSSRILPTTGWTGRMQVRAERSDTAPILLEATTANARLVTGKQDDPVLPYAVGLFLTHEDTAGLPAGAILHYDLELTDPAGFRMTFYYGELKVLGDVTR